MARQLDQATAGNLGAISREFRQCMQAAMSDYRPMDPIQELVDEAHGKLDQALGDHKMSPASVIRARTGLAPRSSASGTVTELNGHRPRGDGAA